MTGTYRYRIKNPMNLMYRSPPAAKPQDRRNPAEQRGILRRTSLWRNAWNWQNLKCYGSRNTAILGRCTASFVKPCPGDRPNDTHCSRRRKTSWSTRVCACHTWVGRSARSHNKSRRLSSFPCGASRKAGHRSGSNVSIPYATPSSAFAPCVEQREDVYRVNISRSESSLPIFQVYPGKHLECKTSLSDLLWISCIRTAL